MYEPELLDLPLLPLRDVVVYPHMVIPLFVGRDKSIQALETAMNGQKKIFVVAQKDAADDDPNQTGLYTVGTVATILQLLKLPDGTVKVLVEGQRRALVDEIVDTGRFLLATVKEYRNEALEPLEVEGLSRSLLAEFEQYVKQAKKVTPEVLTSVQAIKEPYRLSDTIAAHLSLKLEEKQEILEILDLEQRVEHLLGVMDSEVDLLKVEKRIRGRVKKQMEKTQREYYLNEQIKAIHKELGDLGENGGSAENEFAELEHRVEKAGLPIEARKKVDSELKKLRMMPPMSAESTVVRSYVEWMLSVPWKKRSRIGIDLKLARQILDADHYGLEEVKERVLEFLAVQSRVKKLQGPVLCLVGPPGVGKTSLGQSIAKATKREFVRMALGGVRDESEIRGHRRTYIGSMPGKLIQRLAKVGVKNPLFLLDEIDKMGADSRGDPASALLEVLDAEQNQHFNDHYLDVDYDLSEVMFLCTANSMDIPAPLLDRMEVIRLPGYTEAEKVNIAQKYLVPKQIQLAGLKAKELVVEESAIRELVRRYTREAGVRNLEREVSKICRKVVKEAVLGESSAATVVVTANNLEHYCGVYKFSFGKAEEKDQIGQVTGLAWTSVGGELLTIEAVATTGKGRFTMTGKLGDVMQESIKAAVTVVRSRSKMLGISPEFHETKTCIFTFLKGLLLKMGLVQV
jgi:ATP-dependent Lon protease